MVTFGLLGLLIFCQTNVGSTGADSRRPIWNIAHMVNSKSQADEFLNYGANALEADIVFDRDGTATHTYHGVPCDCFRGCRHSEKIADYLSYMSQLATPGDPKFRENFILLFLDLKLKSVDTQSLHAAGQSIAANLLEHYWKHGRSAGRAYIVFSIPSVKYIDAIKGFRFYMTSYMIARQLPYGYGAKVGYDISGNERLDEVINSLRSAGVTKNIWLSDGISNCLPRGTTRLRNEIRLRNQLSKNYAQKVYWWTVDRVSTMRSTLSLTVDAIITNHPDRLVKVLNEKEYSWQCRLATIDDDPWMNYADTFGPRTSDLVRKRGGETIHQDENGEEEYDEVLDNCC